MGKRKLKTVFWVFLLLIVTGLIGCKQKEPEKEQLCHIVMEKGDGYQVTDPVRTIKSGSNVSFTVTLDNNWQLLGTDYHGETEIIKDDDGKTVEIVLHEVKYSESICIQAEKGKYEILYDANGGQNTSGDSDRVSICYRGTHQRINTSIGTDLFFRKGYTLLGWNTRLMEAARLWDLEAGSRGNQGLCCMHSGRRGQTRQILYTKKYQALQS